MKKRTNKLFILLLVMAFVMGGFYNVKQSVEAEGPFKLGVEVLLSEKKDLLAGKRVGLVTNATGIDQNLNSIIDVMFADKDINLVALYGPEHGARGTEEAGSYVDSYIDADTGLKVWSLYGTTRKPSPEMVADVDVLLFDIQDAGVTYYTYIWTMFYLLEAGAEYNKEIIILDRPNPLGGDYVGGPVIVDPGMSTFVGLKDLATIHGMTVGELALYFKDEFKIDVNLQVVPMKNYDRSKKYDELNIPFVLPSPNLPTTDAVDVYPVTGFFETFSNVSEGRGTTKPFQLVGANFINSTQYAKALNDLQLPGVRFRAAAFKPSAGQKLANTQANGVEVYVLDNKLYDPIRTGLYMLKTLNDLYPNDVVWRSDQWLGKLTGKAWVEQDIKNGVAIDDIIAKWQDELNTFKTKREKYLLYESSSDIVIDKNALLVEIEKEANYNKTDYTEASFAVYTIALDQAKVVLQDAKATQAEVNTALSNLITATNALVKIDTITIDSTLLEAEVKKSADLKEADYTAESWKAFQETLTLANTLLTRIADKQVVTQSEVDATLKLLTNAKVALVKKAVKPDVIPSDNTNGNNNQAPSTGDTTNLMYYMFLLATTLGLASISVFKLRKLSKN